MAAVDAPLLHTTTLIGEDTDLLVLLLYYMDREIVSAFISDQTRQKLMAVLKCMTFNI